jgi:IS1 family transposase
MGKCSNAFLSETTNMIKAKLYMKDHWNVLYQATVFYADRKSKMVAIAGHRLTLAAILNIRLERKTVTL